MEALDSRMLMGYAELLKAIFNNTAEANSHRFRKLIGMRAETPTECATMYREVLRDVVAHHCVSSPRSQHVSENEKFKNREEKLNVFF